MREVVTPTQLRELARSALDIANDDGARESDRLGAMDWLAVHTKGRPGTASPAIDPLELPTVRDAASALLALGEIIGALSSGKICGDSAKLYASLVGDAAKIATANKVVDLLAAGGLPEFLFSDDRPLEEQLPEAMAFLERAMRARISSAGAPASP